MKTMFAVLSAMLVLSTAASATTTAETTRGYTRNRNGQIEYFGFTYQAVNASNPFPNTRPSYFNISAALKDGTLSSAQYNLMQQCTQNARSKAIQLTLVKTSKPSSPGNYPTPGHGSCLPQDPWCGHLPDPSLPNYPSSGGGGCMPSDPWCASTKVMVKSVTCVDAPGYLAKFRSLIQSAEI